jgi:hypothetical protein
VSAISRAVQGTKAVVGDPVGRRAYLARLKWLMNGSETLQAHSLEYRAGLTGRFAIPAERVSSDAEIVMHCPDGCGAHAPLSHLYEQRFVYRLRQTVASTASGATLMCGSAEDPFFVRESITWPFESILSHGLEVPEVKQVAERISGTSVVFPTTPNYYHWLIEDLPQTLRAAEVAPEATYLAFSEGITNRHRLVAQHLGIRLMPAEVVVAMDEQVLPGRSSDSWFVHPADARRLHDLGAAITSGETGDADRIYVSRRNAARALPGEAQLEALLVERGFAILHLEEMDWADQIRAFRGARVIVGPHGAGLANLVFTPAAARLVELTNGNQYNRCFEWICHVAGHDYRAVDSDAFADSADPQRLVNLVDEAILS